MGLVACRYGIRHLMQLDIDQLDGRENAGKYLVDMDAAGLA